jgi:hypothetical protein
VCPRSDEPQLFRGAKDVNDGQMFYEQPGPDGHAVESAVPVHVGAGITMMLPKVLNAVAVTESDVTVTTPDGTADCYFVHPATGTGAAVLVWPDIFGLRPAFRQMGKRLAESGYSVLVVNPFYRVKTAPTAAAGAATPIAYVLPLARGLNLLVAKTKAHVLVAMAGAHRIPASTTNPKPRKRGDVCSRYTERRWRSAS